MLGAVGLLRVLLAGFGFFGSLSPGLELWQIKFLFFFGGEGVSPARMVKGWG